MSQHLVGTMVLYPIRLSVRLFVSFTHDEVKFSSKAVCLRPHAATGMGLPWNPSILLPVSYLFYQRMSR